jgi:hypothetical protein
MHRLDASLASDLDGLRELEGEIVVGSNIVHGASGVHEGPGVLAACTVGQLLSFSQNYFMGRV